MKIPFEPTVRYDRQYVTTDSTLRPTVRYDGQYVMTDSTL